MSHDKSKNYLNITLLVVGVCVLIAVWRDTQNNASRNRIPEKTANVASSPQHRIDATASLSDSTHRGPAFDSNTSSTWQLPPLTADTPVGNQNVAPPRTGNPIADQNSRFSGTVSARQQPEQHQATPISRLSRTAPQTPSASQTSAVPQTPPAPKSSFAAKRPTQQISDQSVVRASYAKPTPAAANRPVNKTNSGAIVASERHNRGMDLESARYNLNNNLPEPTNNRNLSRLVADRKVESEAMERIAYGKSLARRGAFFAAREEFLDAMYLVAESYDVRAGSSDYSHRLKAGLRALEECKDFGKVSRDNATAEAMKFILASHNTKLSTPEKTHRQTRSQLIDNYCRFAKTAMEQALGKSAAASESLFAYAKLMAADPQQTVKHSYVENQTSWAIFLASANIGPNNHRSANELGVRLLKSGKLDNAEQMFKRAISTGNETVYWSNLAELYLQKSRQARNAHEQNSHSVLAQRAMDKARSLALEPKPQQSESWVSIQQFQQDAAMPDSRLGLEQQIRPQPSVPLEARRPNTEPEQGIINNIRKWF